jgi:hypothetical protein
MRRCVCVAVGVVLIIETVVLIIETGEGLAGGFVVQVIARCTVADEAARRGGHIIWPWPWPCANNGHGQWHQDIGYRWYLATAHAYMQYYLY